MKHPFTMLMLVCCNTLHAQYRLMAPQPPVYDIVDQPGATLVRVIDTMYANANMADTGEGGEVEQLGYFKAYWQQRVSANDSSGQNKQICS